MRQKTSIILVISFVLSVMATFIISTLSYAGETFAYIDLAKVFDKYQKTKEYDGILDKKQKNYDKQRENKVGEVRKLQEKLSLLSENERESRKDRWTIRTKLNPGQRHPGKNHRIPGIKNRRGEHE